MPNGDDLKREAFFRLETLRRAIREIGPQVRWARSARFLWNLIRGSVDGLLAQLEHLSAQDPEYQQTVEVIQNVTDVLHALLGYVAAGQPERVHQAIVSALEHLVERISPKSRVLVCYDWTPSNYGYLEAFREKLDAVVRRSVAHDAVPPKTQTAATLVPDMFAIVFLPAAERDSVLLHSALAHEMGHALSEVAAMAVNPAMEMPEMVTQQLVAMSAEELAAFVPEFYERCQQWQRELVADTWSVCLLGPAPAMSLYHLAPNAGPSKTHPDSNLRFRLMSACLQKLDFLGQPQDPAELGWLTDTLQTAVVGSQSAIDDCQEPVLKLSHEYLKHNIQSIADMVVELALQNFPAYARGAWEADYAQDAEMPRHQLVRRILNAVPPDAVERAGEDAVASLPAILNAGWAVYADNERWQQFCGIFWEEGQWDQFESRRRLQNLLLKAIDTVNVKREWEAQA